MTIIVRLMCTPVAAAAYLCSLIISTLWHAVRLSSHDGWNEGRL